MTKALNASCVTGVVIQDGVPIPDAEIMSAGIGPSSGLLILDGTKKYYVAIPTDDLKAILDLIGTMADAISTGIIGTHSTVSGVNAVVDVAAALTVAMTAVKASATALKGVLR
jgi:hypothetical protein